MTPSPPSVMTLPKNTIIDLSGIDFAGHVASRELIAKQNPHRHEMALLDEVIWTSADMKKGVAVWRVRHDEFWIRGHFPQKPLLPGVLMVEAGAQLSVFLYNSRYAVPKLCGFTHISDCSFRSQVAPGDTFYIITDEIKASDRRFNSRVQGFVRDRIVFDAVVEGISLGAANTLS